jgi:hypothetical protein
MVNTLVLYDVPDRKTRLRLESLLRANGFAYLFPYARWSPRAMRHHHSLGRAIRCRLRGGSYRIVFLEISDSSRTGALWLSEYPRGDSR